MTWDEPTDGSLAPQWVIKKLSEMADPSTIWVTGVGQHQMWASQFIDFENQHAWISSGGLGTMGYGLPAASAHPWARPVNSRARSRCG